MRRKLTTLLFCDVVGSTALAERLEAEAVREVMLRFYEECSQVIAQYDGMTAKFIGDAVLAVFGLPSTREDDAERALRAALALRRQLDEVVNVELAAAYGVELGIRMGINSGVVVAGEAWTDEALPLGDTANTAARLEQAAAAGEILISQSTFELTAHLARTEAVAPIAAKGKAEPLRAYRLLEVREGRRPLRTQTAMVGRSHELAALRQALELVRETGSGRLIAVTGEAGVGKSRLLGELQRTTEGVSFLYGRCLSYGEGITYWPLVEVVKQLALIRDDDTPGIALDRLERCLDGDEFSARAGRLLAQTLGLAEGSATPEDIAWAARKLLDVAATRQPTVLCLDDVQWAEPGFLNLIDTVVATSESPLLVVALGRPELRELRPAWSTLDLNPLSPDETRVLLERLGALDDALQDVVVRKADGNPLFVEELVAAVYADPTLELPKTIEALLSSRLDRLGPSERTTVESGAVEGEQFHQDAVAYLAPTISADELEATLSSLTATELVRREPPVFGQSPAYRFRNLLIRDAVYAGIRKQARAELHEQFAAWLTGMAGERLPEWEEVVAYHLEQSYLLRSELGNLDGHAQGVGSEAADRLASSGRRALARGDMRAASGLLSRATALVPHEPARQVELGLECARALRYAGDRAGSGQVVADVLEQATSLHEERLELLCRLEEAVVNLYWTTTADADAAVALADTALARYAGTDDHGVLAAAYELHGHVAWVRCRGEVMESAFTSALSHVARSGTKRSPYWIHHRLPDSYFHGPTPVPLAIERCEVVLDKARGHGVVEVATRAKIAGLWAMTGDIARARAGVDACLRMAAEIGLGPMPGSAVNYIGMIELLAGDLDAAEAHLRAGCEVLTSTGETSTYSTAVGLLGRTLERKGALEGAEACTHHSEEAGGPDDLATQVVWRGVRARVLARRGMTQQALTLATEAVELAARTDFLAWRGEALLDLAQVLGLAGEPADAVEAAAEALGLFETKGNVVLAEQARRAMAEWKAALPLPR
jgi:class 3 adenylate cyclase